MSTDHQLHTASFVAPLPLPVCPVGRLRALHRIEEVRRREGFSRRTMARRLGTDLKTVQREEGRTTDMPLSRLHQWQAALGVPIAELLVDADESLSPPLLKRAQVLRLMKTAASIRERAESLAIQRMAQMLVEQIMEIMPEVRDVTPWNATGHRRTLDELGEAANRWFSIEALEELAE